MTRHTRCTGLIALALAGLVVSALASCVSAPAGPRPAPIELSLQPYVANLRTVSITVAGKVAPFILDTAGGLTTVTPEFARTIGCAPFGRVTGVRSSGERFDMARCGPVPIVLGPTVRTTELVIFDLMALLGNAPPVAGIVSLHTLQTVPFTLDLAANRLFVETPRSLAQRIAGTRKLSIRTSRQAGGASVDLFIEAHTPRGSIWLEVDSGNVGPTLLSPHALAQLGLSQAPDRPGFTGAPATLDIAGLGPVPVQCATKDMIYDGLLNAAFLESIVLTVDLPSGQAWASKRR